MAGMLFTGCGFPAFAPILLRGETDLPIAWMLMLSHGIPPVIVAGVTCMFFMRPEFWADAGSLPGDLNDHLCSRSSLSSVHSLYIARYAPCGRNFPGTQDEATRLMDEILTPIPIDLRDLG